MAELVGAARGRRGDTERADTAIPVRAALPAPNPANQWAHWRGNHSAPSKKSATEMDHELITKLLESRVVSLNELFSYITPEGLLRQGRKIDALNQDILDIINNMAKTRRMLLDLKRKGKPNPNAVKELEEELLFWPVEVQQLQGQIQELEGRYLRIPPLLVSEVKLIA